MVTTNCNDYVYQTGVMFRDPCSSPSDESEIVMTDTAGLGVSSSVMVGWCITRLCFPV